MSSAGDASPWRRRIEEGLRRRGILAPRLAEAAVVAVVIGPGLAQGHVAGDDFEGRLRGALESGKILVPILVDGARMEDVRRLPDLGELTFRQAITVRLEEDLEGALVHLASAATAARGEPAATGCVFISYRRDDTAHWARWLAREAALTLGSSSVFLDVGSGRAGRDFRTEIRLALERSREVVVVVGEGFLATDETGGRRVDDPDDPVRSEIAMALSLGKRVHVVLTGGARMPSRAGLPADIAALAETTSVLRLGSPQQVRQVVAAVLGRGAARPGPGMPLLRPLPGRSPHERFLASARDGLAVYGWEAAGEIRKQRGRSVWTVLKHPSFRGHRMVLHPGLAEVWLEERAGIRWVRRAGFPVSPHLPDDLDVLRLPDRLHDAARDPDNFLERSGRVNLKSAPPPPMSADRLYQVLRQGNPPNPQAIDAYLRTRRDAAVRRHGVKLAWQRNLLLSGDAMVRAVAFFPDGERLAAASNDGAAVFDLAAGRPTTLKRSGCYGSVDVSCHSHVALASDKGRVAIWDSELSPVESCVSPYGWWKRLASEPELSSVAWTRSGDSLACCGQDAVWTARLGRHRFSRWDYPEQAPSSHSPTVRFCPGDGAFVVLAHGRRAWLVDTATGGTRGVLEAVGRRRSTGLPDGSAQSSGAAGLVLHEMFDLDVSPCGELLAVAGSDGQIALHDLPSLGHRRTLVGHDPQADLFVKVVAVVFSPDGRWLASLGSDRRLVVWSTETWLPEAEGAVSRSILNSGDRPLAWSPDATTLAVCPSSGPLEIWRLSTDG